MDRRLLGIARLVASAIVTIPIIAFVATLVGGVIGALAAGEPHSCGGG